MQIIIPMSGSGERFRRAGFKDPKPLINVDGKPIIAHVIDLFPGEKDFVFICNRHHLESTSMRSVLEQYCPTGKIIPIEPHKFGPVYAVAQAYPEIDDQSQAIVNYCDFSCYWDYGHFKKWLEDTKPDGCIPAYRGFHPHSLGDTNYAFMRVQEGCVTEIQDKKPFTANKIDEFASSGTYYFASGDSLKRFFSEALSRDLSTNGEYYCSLVYNLMINRGLSVSLYELQHFMQWGTPQDLSEYLRWSAAFKALVSPVQEVPVADGTTLIPMAGLGTRFSKAGYNVPKPLLRITAQPMVFQSVRSLPPTTANQFVTLGYYLEGTDLEDQAIQHFPGAFFTRLEAPTKGQVCTCIEAMSHISHEKPLTITACDHAALFDIKEYNKMMADPKVDLIVWVTRGHPNASRNPTMYGWVDSDGPNITKVSVKEPLDDPSTDPMIIGTFTFKRAEIFSQAAKALVARQGFIKGEYYVDACIQDALSLGLRCVIFEVKHYLCWGTPTELQTFKYWQSCFHKWPSHEYNWNDDKWLGNSRVEDQEHLLAIYPSLSGEFSS